MSWADAAGILQLPFISRTKPSKPTFSQRIVAALLACLERLIGFLQDPPSPNPHLGGAYAPNRRPFHLFHPRVEGEIPPDINGVFARVGPNPYYEPIGGYHVFDGDGCVVAVRVKKKSEARGKKRERVRVWWGWVNTEKLEWEREMGQPVRANLGGIRGLGGIVRILMRWVRRKLGVVGDESVGNTSLYWWDGRLMALFEGGLPYGLVVGEDGEVSTAGKIMFRGKLDKMVFSAHPKKGKDGRLYAVNYKWNRKIPAEVVVLDPNGDLVKKVDLPLGRSPLIHDTAVTDHYLLIMDMPLLFDKQEMLRGGLPCRFDEDAPARIGLMPIESNSFDEIRWFQVKNGFVFHTVAMWEEGDTVVLWVCHMTRVDMEIDVGGVRLVEPKLVKWELNLNSGKVTEVVEYDLHKVDFPVINDALLGKKARYCYLSILDHVALPAGVSPIDDMTGVVKFDMVNRKEVGVIKFSGKEEHIVTGGECAFVPRDNPKSEDDGYLLSLVHDWTKSQSELRIYDSKTMNPDPIAAIILENRRIPSGFHGIFIPEKELRKQRAWV